MWHPSQLDDTLKRRSFLGLLAGGTGLLAAQLPRANAAATLDVTINLTSYTTGQFQDIYALSFDLQNNAGEPVRPVPTVWGVGRRTQHPWEVRTGPLPLPVGETATYRVWAPGHHEAVRAPTDKQSQLTVYDRGREARAVTYFTAESDLQHRTEVDA